MTFRNKIFVSFLFNWSVFLLLYVQSEREYCFVVWTWSAVAQEQNQNSKTVIYVVLEEDEITRSLTLALSLHSLLENGKRHQNEKK